MKQLQVENARPKLMNADVSMQNALIKEACCKKKCHGHPLPGSRCLQGSEGQRRDMGGGLDWWTLSKKKYTPANFSVGVYFFNNVVGSLPANITNLREQ